MPKLIPQDFISDLLSKIDISDVIGSRVKLRRAGTNLLGLCPFHHEKTPSFTVSPPKQFFHCFGCGTHGNAINFIMQFERLTFTEAVETLAIHGGLTIPHTLTNDKAANYTELYQLLDKVTLFFEQQLLRTPRVITYLKQRGLSKDICQKFRLGYAPQNWQNLEQLYTHTPSIKQHLITTGMLIPKDKQVYARFRDRITFPIRNSRGQILGFGGRTLGDDPAKYLNSPDTCLFHKGGEIYGLYELKRSKSQADHIIVVEGYLDTITPAQFGITNVVATLGTAITTKQIQLLLRHTQNIVFCFDGDLAGQRAAWRALENSLPIMRDGIQIKFLFLPQEHDPDSFIRQESKDKWLALLTTTVPLADFLINHLTTNINLQTIDGKTKFTTLVRELIQKMPHGVFYQFLLQKIATLLQINAEELQKTQTTSSNLQQTHQLSHPDIAQVQATSCSIKIPIPLQKAINILLHHPYLVVHINILAKNLKKITLTGIEILLELISLLQIKPDLQLGAILENWRERKEYEFLQQLACTEPIIAADNLKNELLGIMEMLAQLEKEKTIQEMMMQATQGKLSIKDRTLLQELIKTSKHRHTI